MAQHSFRTLKNAAGSCGESVIRRGFRIAPLPFVTPRAGDQRHLGTGLATAL